MPRLSAPVYVVDSKGLQWVLTPDDEVPAWAVEKITNPGAWEDGILPDRPADTVLINDVLVHESPAAVLVDAEPADAPADADADADSDDDDADADADAPEKAKPARRTRTRAAAKPQAKTAE